MSEDRQSKSVTAPPKCGISGCYASAGTSGFCSLDHELKSRMPAPAPEAPPEWAMEAAKGVERLPVCQVCDMLGLPCDHMREEAARLIHAAWLASEEARKLEHEHRFITDEDGAVHGCECGQKYRRPR